MRALWCKGSFISGIILWTRTDFYIDSLAFLFASVYRGVNSTEQRKNLSPSCQVNVRRNSCLLFGRDFEQKKSNKQQRAIPCGIFLISDSVGNNCLTGTLLDSCLCILSQLHRLLNPGMRLCRCPCQCLLVRLFQLSVFCITDYHTWGIFRLMCKEMSHVIRRTMNN